jgi:hypothetical protein
MPGSLIPSWVQNRLLDNEKVIAKTTLIYATDKRLLNRFDESRWSSFKFSSLDYNQISDITRKKSIQGIIGFVLLLFIFLLMYILFIPDLLGHPYKLGEVWITPFSGKVGDPLIPTVALIIAIIATIILILIYPLSYYQIHSPDLDRKHMRNWRIYVPCLLNGKTHRFIKIVKEEVAKNTKK